MVSEGGTPLKIQEGKESDDYKLTNFFMSAGFDHKKFGHNKPSSLHFMAPERVMAQVDLSDISTMYKCDTWSVGVILYLFLFGVLPFTGESNAKLVKAITKGKFSIPANMPEEMSSLIDLIKRLVTLDPEERIGVTEALNHPCITKKDA